MKEPCNAHSGIEARIKTLERDVINLWNKWDAMQKLILGVFITLALNLIGILALVTKTYFK